MNLLYISGPTNTLIEMDLVKNGFTLISRSIDNMDICEAIFMTNGWNKIPGAREELHQAMLKGILIVYERAHGSNFNPYELELLKAKLGR